MWNSGQAYRFQCNMVCFAKQRGSWRASPCKNMVLPISQKPFLLQNQNQRINFLFIADFFVLILVGFFCVCCFFFHYVSAKFHLWPSSGDLPRPRIGMMSLVAVSPVITAFHSCCLSHYVFDQVNLWPAWVGFETAIF